ncbi:hypothetical protein NHF48_019715 [Sphingomonas sp. H160509]|uniref:hypothetical protein n=1 Tax=Sphingomonas sp. H160509 TaxID=2955313 RepID=UPI0021E8CF2C|nr:hypothetical protein [Sphingomonas sp. H160509]MDD1452646.1 hypothetical protein [Sphingomonas sp. H160509]
MRADHEAEKAAILTKNKELVAREKAAKTAADEAEAAREEAANTAASKAGDVEAVKAALEKKHKLALDKLTADIASRDTQLGTLLIDNAIKQAITENNVLPQFAKAVEAMLRAGAKIENGEALSADGTPLSDANTAFFKSADAKHFVSAPASAGAGAAGNSTASNAAKWTKPPVTGTEMTEWMRDAVADPVSHNSIATSWNRPDLQV